MEKGRKKVLIAVGAVVAIVVLAALVVGLGGNVVGKFTDLFSKKADGGSGGNDGGGNGNNTRPNTPPIARISLNGTVFEVGTNVQMNGNASTDDKKNETSNGISRYVWDFGDGSTTTDTPQSYVEHVYGQPGQYNITLTVYDSDLASDSAKTTIKVVWPTEPITPPSTILLGEPIFIGVIGNSTEITWEVKSDAKEMNISVSVVGANVRATQANEVSVVLLDPEGTLIDNRTVAVMGSTTFTWDYGASDLTVTGEWVLQIVCSKGAAYVSIDGYVSYI